MKPFESKQQTSLSIGTFAGRASAFLSNLLTGVTTDATSERNSLMKFSELGTLDCICHPDRATEKSSNTSDRRGSCRVCGHEVRAKVVDDVSMMDSREIQQFVKELSRLTRRTEVTEYLQAMDQVEELVH